MSKLVLALFESALNLKIEEISQKVQTALAGAPYGEAFFEITDNEAVIFDDGYIKPTQSVSMAGLNVRFGDEYTVGGLNATAFEAAIDSLQQRVKADVSVTPKPARQIQTMDNHHTGDFHEEISEVDRIRFVKNLAQQVESLALSLGISTLKKVSITLNTKVQRKLIVKRDGSWAVDVNPIVRLGVAPYAKIGDNVYKAFGSAGGSFPLVKITEENSWKPAVLEALNDILNQANAKPFPDVKDPVIVLSSGWMGVLLHEAVGHGLEGDANEANSSVFVGKIGTQVAAKGVYVYDNGTLHDRRGSINVDDEGNLPQKTLLIEDGILRGYMHTERTAKFFGVKPTGNARRENYMYPPLVRMTNTYAEAGDMTEKELIASIQEGFLVTSSTGGSVDPLNGAFKFRVNEAFYIKDGKVQYPVKCPAELSGNALDSLMGITAIANKMELDPGTGTCGKQGQGVPVGIGQAMMAINSLKLTKTED